MLEPTNDEDELATGDWEPWLAERFVAYLLRDAAGQQRPAADVYNIAPEYFGFTFVLNGVGLIVFSQATARWLQYYPAPPLLMASLAANALIGAGGLWFGMTDWGGIYGLIPWMFLYCSLMGSINPVSAGLTMRHFGHAAGMASALIGILQYGGGALASLAMGLFTARTAIPMTALIAGFGISGWITYLLLRPVRAVVSTAQLSVEPPFIASAITVAVPALLR